ncbi:aspartate carbamoyltransferase catalytic subunit [Nesterenkonia alkaliphila]|uniref:Aspartate carbamoyltransferase n=1 Tax=Nesterenkonia alkaliphila TaxID=1463631 RepID=A0A7K1UL77_9MICC|nr:aspartate carbamoyltransferase catalytic subunit [Nesterenkonia alkaliphila]MVT27082.1 aspartate carbamoyltransferase catalytic subunit [Nesterenkonia alkaliphila]GFZ88963.1 aspartate carbamoyltransferase [Nesterenkonia alkaliphila]
MRHLLATEGLTYDDALTILDTAEEMAAVTSREVKKLPTLRGRTVVNLFYEDSTRTRVSFEAAAKRLSADVVNFSAKGSSVSKGESLKDTVQTLDAMGADAIVIRHSAAGAAAQLAASDWSEAAVVNAGDGTHEHPTQALLDALTLRRDWHAAHRGSGSSTSPRGTDLAGMRVLIVGDILHSRVARSNLWLLRTLGAEVHFAAPATLLPLGVESWPVTVHYSLDQALAAAPDAVMMLRVQAERMGGAFFPTAAEYTRRWGLTDERLATVADLTLGETQSPALILHPGPMNRGVEISAAAADAPQTRITEQVTNGVAVRMAVLHLLLTGDHA